MKKLTVCILACSVRVDLHRPGQGPGDCDRQPQRQSLRRIEERSQRCFYRRLNGTRAAATLCRFCSKAGTAHEEFLQAYIGKNDTAYRAGWRSLVFSGQASMPKSLDSDAAVVEFVAHNAGAIGYIGKATPHEGVKVLTVR